MMKGRFKDKEDSSLNDNAVSTTVYCDPLMKSVVEKIELFENRFQHLTASMDRLSESTIHQNMTDLETTKSLSVESQM